MPAPFEVIDFNNWKDFHTFVEDTFNYKRNYVFRGHLDSSWKLETTLDRLINQLTVELRKENIVENHLLRFKKAIRGRRGTNPAPLEKADECWALGQHYGLATPLLDWSQSPFIATFFAFNSNSKSSNGRRCLWAIQQQTVKEKSKIIRAEYEKFSEAEKADYFEKTRPPIVEFSEPSFEDNQRIINQTGLFSRGPILKTLEEWVEKQCQDCKEVVLYKLTLPDEIRETTLVALDQMNINSASLFPDITGACHYCNEFLSLRSEMFKTIKSR